MSFLFFSCSHHSNEGEKIGTTHPVTRMQLMIDRTTDAFLEILSDGKDFEGYLTKNVGNFVESNKTRALEVKATVKDHIYYMQGKILRGGQKVRLNTQELLAFLDAIEQEKKIEIKIGNMQRTIELEEFFKQYKAFKEKYRGKG